ncbi:MAG: oligosaccharide flippase family protein [Oscillospiraceae bacterium]|nr:oligosaccharide flippase family protein [Oscillospiraceae bacterium]
MGQTDLTKGGVFKPLVKYAAPLVLSSVLQAMYGLVDTIVAGQFIGAEALSGLTNANTITNMATQILIGRCNGGGILIGQYFGAKKRSETHQATATLFLGSLAAGLIATALLVLLGRPMLIALGAPALEEAAVYLITCGAGFLLVAAYNGASAPLRGV